MASYFFFLPFLHFMLIQRLTLNSGQSDLNQWKNGIADGFKVLLVAWKEDQSPANSSTRNPSSSSWSSCNPVTTFLRGLCNVTT